MCVGLSLGFVSCSIDLYFCFCASTILSWLLNSDSLTSSFQFVFLLFLFLLWLPRTSKTVLNNSGKSGHPCLLPDLRGNVFSFLPLSMMFAWVCHIWPLLSWVVGVLFKGNNICCYGLNCVSPKCICWSPNPNYLRCDYRSSSTYNGVTFQ